MSDMTAEQALEWLRTIAAISGAVVSDRPLSFSYQDAVKFQAAVKALSDPCYVRVPVEPTAEMIRKGQGQWSGESMVEIYKAMLAAATGESHD